MNLAQVAESFEAWARSDPLWAIASRPDKRGAWDEAEFFETGRRKVAAIFDHLARLGVAVPAAEASFKSEAARRTGLDFGCGVGRLTQALAERFEAVVGVDVSPTMLALAERKNRFGPRCRYLLNTEPHLAQFRDASFDFVLSIVVLQHLAPDDAAVYIREFLRVLEPGGVLVFQEISEPAPRSGRGGASREAGAATEPASADAATARRPSAEPAACRADEPRIQMRPLHRDVVTKLIAEAGATLLDAVENGAGGLDWVSYEYYAARRGSAE